MKILKGDNYRINPIKPIKVRRQETERKKIGITGRDTLDRDDWRAFCKTLDRILFKFDDPIIVTLASPNHEVDRLVHRYCYANWLMLRRHHLDGTKPMVIAQDNRMLEFLNDCDLLLVFHEDGDDKTDYVITTARVLVQVPIKVVLV